MFMQDVFFTTNALCSNQLYDGGESRKSCRRNGSAAAAATSERLPWLALRHAAVPFRRGSIGSTTAGQYPDHRLGLSHLSL